MRALLIFGPCRSDIVALSFVPQVKLEMVAFGTLFFRSKVAIVILLFACGSAFGQIHDPEALAEARAALASERQKVVEEDLLLTDGEARAFWPVYASYRKEMTAVRDRQTELITGYLKAYDAADLSDSYADKLLRDYMSIESDVLKVRQRFLNRFKKVLPSLKVARFYQIENKIDAEIDVNLANMIPLVEPD